MTIPVLIMRPSGEHSAPTDQTLGAKLCAGPDVLWREEFFDRETPADLERQFAPWRGRIKAVIGATRAAESQRLGEVADDMGVLAFFPNNNPSIWQRRSHLFHIGFPWQQTAAALAAELVQKTNRRRYLLLHDSTQFQSNVASNMQEKLKGYGIDVRSLDYKPGTPLDLAGKWKPELIYVVFSSERKAAEIVPMINDQAPDIPIVIGRSLLRESFLKILQGRTGEFWFVDTIFRRARVHTETQQQVMQVMEENAIKVPTTNHAFGWDCMKFCTMALKAGDGDVKRAIDYLESGVTLEGATGTCSFSADNHNGRHGLGPTILSRWNQGRFEDL